MAAIGYVNRQADGSYKGFINTLSIRRSVVLLPNRDKDADTSRTSGSSPTTASGSSSAPPGSGWARTRATAMSR